MKLGQLVKLRDDSHRWSSFVDLSRLGVVLGHDHGRARILFTDGEVELHWYFSLEAINETTRT